MIKEIKHVEADDNKTAIDVQKCPQYYFIYKTSDDNCAATISIDSKTIETLNKSRQYKNCGDGRFVERVHHNERRLGQTPICNRQILTRNWRRD